MSMPSLLSREGAHVLTLGDDENRFSPAWLDAIDALLDQEGEQGRNQDGAKTDRQHMAPLNARSQVQADHP